jgi:hypothetical protein
VPGTGHDAVLQQSSHRPPWAYYLQLLVFAILADLPSDIVQLSDNHEQRIYPIHDYPLTASAYPAVKMEKRCVRCPLADEMSCAGFLVRRFCELIDPACPQYDPGYLQVIVRESLPPPPSDDLSAAFAADARSVPTPPIRMNHPAYFDCCGGQTPPGVYDR